MDVDAGIRNLVDRCVFIRHRDVPTIRVEQYRRPVIIGSVAKTSVCIIGKFDKNVQKAGRGLGRQGMDGE
jgi:hypothetical protein